MTNFAPAADNFVAYLKKRQGRPYAKAMGETGTFVRARRLELGLTLEDVAGAVGVSPQAISLIELGKTHNLKAFTAVRLAKALKVDIEALLSVPA